MQSAIIISELMINAGVEMFGNTPVFSYGENAALRTQRFSFS